MTQEINKRVHDESHYDVYSNKIELAVETQKAIGRKFLPRGFLAVSIWEKRNNDIHAPTEEATRDEEEALAQVQCKITEYPRKTNNQIVVENNKSGATHLE
jgi:hypothetical protein